MSVVARFESKLEKTDLLRKSLDLIKSKVAQTGSENAKIYTNLGIQNRVSQIIKSQCSDNKQLSIISNDGKIILTGTDNNTSMARKVLNDREKSLNSSLIYPRMRKQFIKDGIVDQVFSRWPGQSVILKSTFSPQCTSKPIVSIGHPVQVEKSIFTPALTIDPSNVSPETKNGISNKERYFTIALTYLDNPNLETGSYHETCHWLVTDIKIPIDEKNQTYIHIPQTISPYINLSEESSKINNKIELEEKDKIISEFKSNFDEVNRDPLDSEIDTYYKMKNPVSHLIQSEFLKDYLKKNNFTFNNVQDKLFDCKTISAKLFNRETGEETSIETGNIVFNYVPPHPALQYPKRKQRFMIYLLEQEKELGNDFKEQIAKPNKGYDNINIKDFNSEDRESFLPYLKFEETLMKQFGLKLVGTNYFNSMYSRGSDTLYRRLGIHEPVFGHKPSPKQFETIHKSASIIPVGGFESKPTKISSKDILNNELQDRIKKQQFFVYEEYKRNPRPSIFEKAGSLIRERALKSIEKS